MTKRTKKTTKNTDIPATRPITKEEAKEKFLRSLGNANHVATFARIMDAVLEMKNEAFSVGDVLYFSQPWLLEPRTVIELFEKWKSFMQNCGKLAAIENPIWNEQYYTTIR